MNARIGHPGRQTIPQKMKAFAPLPPTHPNVRSRLGGAVLGVRQSWRALTLVVLAAVLGGCDGAHMLGNGGDDRLSAPLNTISIYQLAGRLDMSVEGNSRLMATLSDSANIVMVFGDPGGQVYVNGTPVGQAGGIRPGGGILFLPERLESEIRPALRIRARVRPRIVPRQRRSVIGRVVLDAGHGGRDPGAVSIIGTREKTVVLDVTRTVGEILEGSGVSATLTRRGDTFVELNERADIANRTRADLFVSVHADSAVRRSARGYTVYVARAASADSQALARAIEMRLGGLGIIGRGVRRANYRVLVRTSCPAVLVELGYLSNMSEAGKLAQKDYRDRLARAISEGILDCLRRR